MNAVDTRIAYREAPRPGSPEGVRAGGRKLKIELDGRVYDEHDNLVERWTPADTDESVALSRFLEERAFLASVFAMSQMERGGEVAALRAQQMLNSRGYDGGRAIRMGRNGTVRMDLAPSDVHLPAALPNYASGYRNMPPIADLVSPVILVSKQVDNYFQFDKYDAFQRAEPIGSTGGGEVYEIPPRLGNAQYSCKSRALGGWVSTEVEANADAPLKPMQATAIRIQNAMDIEREIRVAVKAMASGSYDTSVVTALGAGAQWDGGGSSDPIFDLQSAVLKVWGNPTAGVVSRQAYFPFLRNANVQKYFTYKDSATAQPSAKDLKGIAGIPPFIVGAMQYINGAGNKVDVWGGTTANCLLIQQPEQMPPTDQQSVSTLATFRWDGTGLRPKDGVVGAGGYIVRRFFTENRGDLGGEKIVIVNFDYEAITSAFAAALITGVYQ